MMRSLYSGISGLRNHQTRMDVIGNNIANVNTTGFKASRVIFQDIFSQTIGTGMGNDPEAGAGAFGVGGTNPMQIGLGMRVSTVDVLHNRGNFQSTGNPLDMMIDGDGFFVVLGSEGPEDFFFTRAGNFNIDNQGFLVTSNGEFVLGEVFANQLTWVPPVAADPAVDPPVEAADGYWRPGVPGAADSIERQPIRVRLDVVDPGAAANATPPAAEIPNEVVGISVNPDGIVEGFLGGVRVEIARLHVAMFSNPSGLERTGNSLYIESASSGEAQIGRPLDGGAGRISSHGLEMSGVDLSTEFTDMIVTQRGFQANSRIITVSDTMLEELVNLKR